jgi:2-alkenal reductase
MSRLRPFLILLVAAVSLAGVGALPHAVAAQTPAATPAAEIPMDAEAVVRHTRPAVVTVINEQAAPQGLQGAAPGSGGQGNQLQPTGIGTGFLIDQQGHIVTNAHVVEGGTAFQVILQNGDKRDAKLVGADPVSDLAVIQISGSVPGTLPFGNSDQLQVGQSVLAIGSALGDFTGTVTEGIIGALGRDIPLQPGMAAYSNLIQHDAAINPGNSGGPLVDANGKVIGVNTLGINDMPQVGPVQGLFFAIPSNEVQRIVQTLITSGSVAYPYLGAQLVELTPDVASQYNLPVQYGAYIARVEQGGAAQQAGIQKGDIITAIGGQKIDSQNSFAELLFSHKPGDQVDVTLQRNGQEQHVTVTLGQRPNGA